MRQEWTFDYPADVVARGARAQRHTQLAKAREWGEREQAAKASYDEVQVETRHLQTSLTSTSFGAAEMSVYHEAQRHRQEHSKRAEEYARWVKILTGEDQDRKLSLTYDDAVYFGIHDEPEDA